MDKFSLTDIRKKNYSDVYRLIYNEKKISKQQIANSLQMSLPTVTQHLTSLLNDGLIEYGGQADSNVGRRAMTYSPKSDAYVSVGVEILSHRVTAVILNLFGDVIHKKSYNIKFSQDDEYFKALSEAVKDLIAESQTEENKVLGIGFGIQGLVSENYRNIIYGKILDCTGLSIESVEKYLPYPCRFFHDSECAAEVELWRDKNLTDALYLSLGQHIGGAVISNSEISKGRTGRTGTFEHMTLSEGGKICYCGKQGCMECYCSGETLLDGEDAESFFSALRKNEHHRNARWVEYLGWLALALNNMHMLIDSIIILGGNIAPFMTEDDLKLLFYLIQLRTAFPEDETFLRLGVKEVDVVAIGAGVPYIKEFLEQV